jgi:streptothricin acetyltransferase
MVAREAGVMLGYVAASRAWNGYARTDDLAVDAARRLGAGRRLMDAAVGWARERAWPGVAAETQSTNVDACRFYERYGFALGGLDRHLYRTLAPGTRQVALFWYLLTPTF